MRRLLFAVLALLAAAPASAHAGEVTLWACHGPDGAPLPFAYSASGSHGGVSRVGGGCEAPGGTLRLGFTNAVGGDAVTLRFATPATLSRVWLDRRVSGPEYHARTTSAELESLLSPGVLDGVFSGAADGTAVELELRCAAAPCDASADVRRAAVTVRDDEAPVVALGGLPSYGHGTFSVRVDATDAGIGLASAHAWLDGVPAGSVTLGHAHCAELSPGDATIDLPLADDCPPAAQIALPVDSTRVADGQHELAVAVLDAAGNTAGARAPLRIVNHPVVVVPTPTPTPTLPPAVAPPVKAVASLHAAKRYKVSRTGALKVAASCPSAAARSCRATVKLSAKLPGGKRATASRRATIRAGRRATLTLKLNAAARRALRSRGALSATLTLAGAKPVGVKLTR
ncbi:MAG TPA: hypothetical protein VNS09_05595 [Solirubrobacter sp.]|nr:hypothetical protein [Solirubrobacter sp.]